ncbi:hypothetical protein M7I_6560 [Glarea lozoyensis 74030]|uniref:Tetraspanin n=1 Tax=Glarea lozoyensis (strain ATCC 74030 / MF5533) TaxID=1104152 RepID=H0EUX0_GLAL7|nr:hypothetical protein M7I_6560 [Glarea lozoyensis 74030]
MARDNILLTYVVVDVLFVVTGALLIIFSINTQIEIAKPFTKDNVVKDLLLGMCPLNVCAIFTLVLGLDIWFETLKTRSNLAVIWSAQPADTQSLIQQVLGCCGYMNSTSPPFVKDATCPNALVAAAQLGCVTPFSGEANNFLDLVFTGAFGIVGIDAVLVILTAIVLKDRKEKERYRFIDEKNGAGAF